MLASDSVLTEQPTVNDVVHSNSLEVTKSLMAEVNKIRESLTRKTAASTEETFNDFTISGQQPDLTSLIGGAIGGVGIADGSTYTENMSTEGSFVEGAKDGAEDGSVEIEGEGILGVAEELLTGAWDHITEDPFTVLANFAIGAAATVGLTAISIVCPPAGAAIIGAGLGSLGVSLWENTGKYVDAADTIAYGGTKDEVAAAESTLQDLGETGVDFLAAGGGAFASVSSSAGRTAVDAIIGAARSYKNVPIAAGEGASTTPVVALERNVTAEVMNREFLVGGRGGTHEKGLEGWWRVSRGDNSESAMSTDTFFSKYSMTSAKGEFRSNTPTYAERLRTDYTSADGAIKAKAGDYLLTTESGELLAMTKNHFTQMYKVLMDRNRASGVGAAIAVNTPTEVQTR